MYEKIIESYINQATVDDLIYYANKNKIILDKNEANIIFNYGKKYWKIIYNGDPTNLFLEIKKQLKPNTYNKIIELYNNYKKNYKSKI